MDTASIDRRLWGRRVSMNLWLLDAVIATVLLLISFLSAGESDASLNLTDPRDELRGVLLLLVIGLPYYFRRHAPLPVLIVSMAGVTALTTLDYAEGFAPNFLLIGAYTLGAYRPAREVLFGYVLFVAGLLAVFVGAPGFGVSNLLGTLAIYSVAFAVGWIFQSRRERYAALEERAAALERGREEEARRAVADERLRIAQELHDVVAHSMGVIAVQAGVGMHVIDSDPAEAKRALEAISTTSRSTLTEIRRLLGVLREEGSGPAYAPAPGLSDLQRLASDVSDAGLPVDLRIEGERAEVPHGVELTAYRIVQEALTNSLKHAGPASASVLVACEDGAVRVEIADDGRGVDARSENGGGHGLTGMRERVAVYGGVLSAGPVAAGGFRVVAHLPYGPSDSDGSRDDSRDYDGDDRS